MKTILIAGAGQLGSRHLQGVKTSRYQLDIWVYDLSNESLKVAEERYNQIESQNKTVHFVTSLDLVPPKLDVVIVATGSKPRAAIIKQILASKTVKYMVLEKFLFPRLAEYQEIEELIKVKGVRTWVNCPRRMWDGYALIKQMIDSSKPVEYIYEGGEWGMCCNTIHFIDIFMFLNGDNSFDISIEGLLPEVVDSKRIGYIELYGTEIVTTKNCSILRLSSSSSFVGETHSIIKNDGNIFDYYEGKGILFVNGSSKEVPMHYQSGLSGLLIDQLIDTGSCILSTYSESSTYHIAYLSKIISFVNKIKGWTSDSCPIT